MSSPTATVAPGTPASQTASQQRSNRLAEATIVVAFLAVISCVILIQTTAELRPGRPVQALEVFQRTPTSTNLRAYEANLQDASLVAKASRPWYQFVQFKSLSDGGDKVLVGRANWLFYKPGFDESLKPPADLQGTTNDPVAAIIGFRDHLKARGIHLVVMPAPNKETVYPDLLTRQARPGSPIVSATTREVLRRLAAASVDCVDLFALFSAYRTNHPAAPPLYLAQDSHWSPEGLSLAAKSVAEKFIAQGTIKRGTIEFRESPATVRRFGDLLQMLRSPLIGKFSVPESVPCSRVLSTEQQPYRDSDNAQVLVLGDSFLRIFQQDEPGAAGFIAHLANELRAPVSSIVNDGGASTLVRQELFRRPGLLKNKKVVLWEFVERDLLLGTEGWQNVPLP